VKGWLVQVETRKIKHFAERHQQYSTQLPEAKKPDSQPKTWWRSPTSLLRRTITFAENMAIVKRRYIYSGSAYARQFLAPMISSRCSSSKNARTHALQLAGLPLNKQWRRMPDA
jgi:hypothetical protein